MKQLYIFEDANQKNEKVHWALYIDGASRGNPGPAAVGIYLIKNEKEVVKKGYFLGQKTNNQAEYYSLIYGLQELKDHYKPDDELQIYSDSELLVRQINGKYKVKHEELKKLYDLAIDLLSKFKYKIEHVPRDKNKVADSLANQALNKQKAQLNN